MEGVGRCDVDLSTECSDQIGSEASQIKEAPPPLELHEKSDVAVRASLAAGDGAEQARMDDPVPAHEHRHFPSNVLDRWAHRVKSTPATRNCPLSQQTHRSGRVETPGSESL